MKLIQLFFVSLSLAYAGLVSAASGQINIKVEAFQEIVELQDDGTVKKTLEAAESLFPGDEVVYLVSFSNIGDQTIDNLVVNDPVPEQTIYKVGSMYGSAAVGEVSVDGGNRYGRLDRLTVVGENGKPQPATAADVTDVRWLVNYSLQPGQTGNVGFRALLK